MQRDAALALLQPGAAAVGDHPVGAETVQCGLVQHAMQPAAMHADFRHRVAGETAARLAVDQLPETIEKAAFLVLDPERLQYLLQP